MKKIEQIIYEVIEETNSEARQGKKIPLKLSSSIWGKKGYLDSLGLVRLIVVLEQKIEKEFHASLSLASEENLNPNGPFATVAKLKKYLTKILGKDD